MAMASTVFSWGFVIVKALGLPAPTIAASRLAIGAVVLLVAALILKTPWPRNLAPVLMAGLFFGAHQLLYIVSTQRTSIAIVTLVGALQPLLVSIVSHRTVGEGVPRALRGWALVAILSVLVVVHADLGDKSQTLLGDLLSVVNLVAFTTFFLSAKRARLGGAPTLTLTASIFAIAMLVVAPALLLVSPALPAHHWQWGLIALLALGPGNGHLLLNWAHSRVSATLASLMLGAVPLLASIWAHFVFGEPYGLEQVAGMLLAMIAIEGGRRAEVRAGMIRMSHPEEIENR